MDCPERPKILLQTLGRLLRLIQVVAQFNSRFSLVHDFRYCLDTHYIHIQMYDYLNRRATTLTMNSSDVLFSRLMTPYSTSRLVAPYCFLTVSYSCSYERPCFFHFHVLFREHHRMYKSASFSDFGYIMSTPGSVVCSFFWSTPWSVVCSLPSLLFGTSLSPLLLRSFRFLYTLLSPFRYNLLRDYLHYRRNWDLPRSNLTTII